MTKETWLKYNSEEYIGKHAPRWYNVYRTVSSDIPMEHLFAYGIEDAEKAVRNYPQYIITTTDGRTVNYL